MKAVCLFGSALKGCSHSDYIQALNGLFFSVCFELLEGISEVKLESVLCSASKILDCSLSIVLVGETTGIAFVLFKSEKEALNAIDLARGRSWRGRQIQVNLAQAEKKKNNIKRTSPYYLGPVLSLQSQASRFD